MRNRVIQTAWGLAAALTAFGWAGAANAAECADLPNPVYIAGASAAKPMVAETAKVLAEQATPITVVYQSIGSCAGVDALINGTPVSASAVFWDKDSGWAETECTFPTAGVRADVGISDTYAESCGGFELGANQHDFFGSIQVMAMVAPLASSENTISAEAAFLTFGFGGEQHAVAPWNSEDHLFIRADSSGTKAMIAKAIGLPSPKWKGLVQSGSGAVNTAVTSSTNPNATIGILAADWADQQRDKMKILAYQHTNQSCGYTPDSTANTFDKINVREGRYAIWGPVHYMTNVDENGTPVPAAGNPAGDYVAAAIRILTHDNLDAATNKAIIDAEIAAYTVPQCAMKVTRHSEIGQPVPFEPAEPCGCYFESQTGAASASCTTCDSDADCGGDTPTCRLGYCEAR